MGNESPKMIGDSLGEANKVRFGQEKHGAEDNPADQMDIEEMMTKNKGATIAAFKCIGAKVEQNGEETSIDATPEQIRDVQSVMGIERPEEPPELRGEAEGVYTSNGDRVKDYEIFGFMEEAKARKYEVREGETSEEAKRRRIREDIQHDQDEWEKMAMDQRAGETDTICWYVIKQMMGYDKEVAITLLKKAGARVEQSGENTFVNATMEQVDVAQKEMGFDPAKNYLGYPYRDKWKELPVKSIHRREDGTMR